MKQIKTILVKAEQLEEFDKKVNAALTEGWTLVKREVLQAYDRATCIFHRMLYAELEREIVEGVRHDCRTCKWVNSDSHREPCRTCGELHNWEAGPDA